MKVFVAGAGGVIGRRLVPMLVADGHQVTGMTRRAERADEIAALGATPAVCDVFDAAVVERVVADATPEVVIHELTDLPAAINPRKAADQLAGNDRIRSVGTSNLVAAALAAGAKRIVAQSIAFAYELRGTRVKSESDPLFDDAPEPWTRSVAALHDLEDAVTKTDGIEGVVLRYGFFYGPGSSYDTKGSFGHAVRKRKLPVVGGGDGVFSFIHTDDAAKATVRAADRSTAPGIYNIVDDEPAPVREWLPAFAQAVDAPSPRRVPAWIARIAAGSYGAMLMTQMRGASNDRAKRELDWTPSYPSWRQGFREGLG